MLTQVVIEETPQRGKESKRLSSTYESQEEALETAKAVIESGLLELWHSGMSVQALLQEWSLLGEDVYVLPDDGTPCFSATEYAKDRAGDLVRQGIL